MLAPGTAVSPGHSACNPLLYPAFEELQINFNVTHLLALVKLLALAQWASIALQRGHSVYPSRGFPPFLGYDFEVGMSPEEHLLPLIIEVGTFRNFLKIFQSVFSGSEQLAAGPRRSQILSRGDLEVSGKKCRTCGIQRDDLPNEVNNMLQLATVVLVVLKQAGFDVRSPIIFPSLPPEYTLQSRGVYV